MASTPAAPLFPPEGLLLLFSPSLCIINPIIGHWAHHMQGVKILFRKWGPPKKERLTLLCQPQPCKSWLQKMVEASVAAGTSGNENHKKGVEAIPHSYLLYAGQCMVHSICPSWSCSSFAIIYIRAKRGSMTGIGIPSWKTHCEKFSLTDRLA